MTVDTVLALVPAGEAQFQEQHDLFFVFDSRRLLCAVVGGKANGLKALWDPGVTDFLERSTHHFVGTLSWESACIRGLDDPKSRRWDDRQANARNVVLYVNRRSLV